MLDNSSGGAVPAVQGGQWGSQNTQFNYYHKEVVEGKRPPPFLAPPRPRYPMVGRDAEIAELKRLLFEGRAVSLVVLPGVGKTAIANSIAYDREVMGRFGDGVLWATLGKDPDVMRALGQWAGAVGFPPEVVDELRTVEARQAAIKARMGELNILLVVDDAWNEDAARSLLVGGPRCAHLLTTRSRRVARAFAGDDAIVLPELGDEDALALLTKHAPSVVPQAPDAARALVQEVGGLPLALVILGRYLTDKSLDGDPDLLPGALGRLRAIRSVVEAEAEDCGERFASLAAAIRMSYDDLDGDAASVLNKLSIFRPKPLSFRLKAAKAVCDPAGALSVDRFAETLQQLRQHGLLDYGQGSYTVHRAISEFAAMQISEEETEELHALAAAHYGGALQKGEDDARALSSYLQCYRYETPEWQNLVCEWLYHLRRLKDRATAGVAFSNVYMEGFWWWGCYVPFPFCERLLREWEQTQPTDEDKNWLRCLRAFSAAYPAGYEKGDHDESWEAVAEALQDLCSLAGLGNAIERLDPDRHHLRALTDIFLAESYRYRDRHDGRADTLYQEAYDLFEAEGATSRWHLAWMHFHMADLEMERGWYTEALTHCQDGIPIGLAQDDCEIVANLLRVRADIAWYRHAQDEALDLYAQAVLYAYLFQWQPHAPDFYTLAFYDEMTHRAIDRLAELFAAGSAAQAEGQTDRLHALWRPLWDLLPRVPDRPDVVAALAARDVERLRAYLFPAPMDGAAGDSGDTPRADPTRLARVREIAQVLPSGKAVVSSTGGPAADG